MEAKQQEALEALVGRSLSADELEKLSPLVTIRNDVAIAELLSVGRRQLRSVEVGYGTIITVMHPNGGRFLRAVEALGAVDDDVFYGIGSVVRGVFNPGLPEGQAMLEVLKAKMQGAFDAELEKMKDYGFGPAPLPFHEVSAVLNAAEGRLTI